MNAAFLLMTTTWLAGADPAPAAAAPAAPVASAPAGGACCGGNCGGGCCDSCCDTCCEKQGCLQKLMSRFHHKSCCDCCDSCCGSCGGCGGCGGAAAGPGAGPDAVYCDQCGVKLEGRDDVEPEPDAEPDNDPDDDGRMELGAAENTSDSESRTLSTLEPLRLLLEHDAVREAFKPTGS